MAVAQDGPPKSIAQAPVAACLEDRFEVLKDIGDGSFGTVVLARVRTAGSNIARRGSVVSWHLRRSLTSVLIGTPDRDQDDEKDL